MVTKIKDLRAMSDNELENKLLEAKKEQFNLRVQQSTGQLQNTAVIKNVRREIAKINTLLAERKKKSEEKEICLKEFFKVLLSVISRIKLSWSA